MNLDELKPLMEAYYQAPGIFQAGRYWKAYEDKIVDSIGKADIKELRSGKYPYFAPFGFNETVYYYHPNLPLHVTLAKKIIRKFFITNRNTLPYSISISDIRDMAYRHCELAGELAQIKPISELEVSTFGNPQDIFEIKGKKYTMSFLTYYVRLCYAQKYLQFKGNEIIVELGSGSGHQIEVFKKVFPDLTVLCFDLPYNIFLCAEYLSAVLEKDMVIKPSKNLDVDSLEKLEKGKVHAFGNWLFPLLKGFNFDVFWNAASFGEMEPHIVKNYLSYVLPECQAIYLLQARKGKESTSSQGVVTPIKFEDYVTMLEGFALVASDDAYEANRKLLQSGGYFHGVWKK